MAATTRLLQQFLQPLPGKPTMHDHVSPGKARAKTLQLPLWLVNEQTEHEQISVLNRRTMLAEQRPDGKKPRDCGA